MKKLFLFVIIPFLLISCKDDDKTNEHPIVGEWQLTDVSVYEIDIKDEAYKDLVLKDLGSLSYSYKCEFNSHNEYFIYGQKFGTYAVKDDTLMLNKRNVREGYYDYPYTSKHLFCIEDKNTFYLIQDRTKPYNTSEWKDFIMRNYGMQVNQEVKSVKIKEVYKRL